MDVEGMQVYDMHTSRQGQQDIQIDILKKESCNKA